MALEYDVAVGVSGGVDSLYALLRLKESGLNVAAMHAIFTAEEQASDPVPALREACDRIGVPLWVEDCRKAFAEQVSRPFAQAYARGWTPNPCAECNRRMKFGLLVDRAGERGAAVMATGHYVKVAEHRSYGRAIVPAADAAKDQAYFLAMVPADRLLAACFPLGDVSKAEVRCTIEAHGFAIPVPRESQDVCFIPGGDYRAVLKKQGMALSGAGNIELDGKVIGRHSGLWRYTEGQRRGLGIAWSEPLYVIAKDCARNVLVVGTASEAGRLECHAEQANFIIDPSIWPNRLFVRLRYRHKAMPATVSLGKNSFDIRFSSPEFGIAPGQVAAIYDEEGVLLAGGLVCREDGACRPSVKSLRSPAEIIS